MGTDLRIAPPPSGSGLLAGSERVRARRIKRAGAGQATSDPPVVRGRTAVIAMRGLLVELCRRTGQAGAMDALEHLVSSPTALDKTPYLVLVGLRPELEPATASANDVLGAVLLYEYRVAGVGSRVFATDDVTAQRTVIAPAEVRSLVAEIACQTLIEQGAQAALVSHEQENEPLEAARPFGWAGVQPGPACEFAVRSRMVARDLILGESLEATLATLGRHTRRNLRYYRRRAELDLGTTFVPSVVIGREEFLELSRSATNRVSDEMAAWRYDCLEAMSGRMFAGVKAADGRWLSVIAGSRHGEVTTVEWQMNRAGLPRYSLSTVTRAFLLEHEVELGTRKLIFKGGTPHSMGYSFAPSEMVDVLVVRRSLRGWLLRRFSRWIFPKSNFLRGMLLDDGVKWNSL